MKQMQKYLHNEMATLKDEIILLKKRIRSYPPGRIRISHSRGAAQFYYVPEIKNPIRDEKDSDKESGRDSRSYSGSDAYRQGLERQGLERQGLERQGLERQGSERQGLERQDKERQGLERQDVGKDFIKKHGISKHSVTENEITEYDINKRGVNRRIYIRKNNMDLIKKLIRKDYDCKLLKRLEKRYNVISKACMVYRETEPEQLYSQLSDARKEIIGSDSQAVINSDYLPDEEYARRWQGVPYNGKMLDRGAVPEIVTVRGEHVRSKSEKILADSFERMDVPYRYEFPLEYRGERTIYPDFTVLNKRTRKEYYLEHLGKMDDPEYAKYAIQRIEEMEMHGIFPGQQLLLSFETGDRPLSQKAINSLIREYLL